MRISDWSSDVCSSDLRDPGQRDEPDARRNRQRDTTGRQRRDAACQCQRNAGEDDRRVAHRPERSEEHTSELQSLMRISYAVFCLKKKNKSTKNIHTRNKKQPYTNTTTHKKTLSI